MKYIKKTMGKYNTNKEFIEKAKLIHGEKYCYSKTKYIQSKDKVIITCLIHGDFEQRAGGHLSGYGCSKCSFENDSIRKTSNTTNFINKSTIIHKNKYDYSKTKYINTKTKVTIICPLHNLEFLQLPQNHLAGNGCPKCNSSKGEIKISTYLENKNIDFIPQKKYIDCVNDKTGKQLPYDFYLPKFNLLIEYDGELHFKPYKKEEKDLLKLKETQYKDKLKTKYSIINNIKLLRIKYSEFKNIDKILDTMLTDEQVFSFISDCEIADDNIKFLLENNSLYE